VSLKLEVTPHVGEGGALTLDILINNESENRPSKMRDLQTHVNYRHKSGLLAAVDAEAERMSEEARFRTTAERELQHSVALEVAPDGVYEVTAPLPSLESRSPVAGP